MKMTPSELAANLESLALEWDERAEKGSLPFSEIGPTETGNARRIAAGYRQLAIDVLKPFPTLRQRKVA